MQDQILSKRYVKALRNVLAKKGDVDPVFTGLIALITGIEADVKLNAFLENPVISSENKISVLKSIVEEKHQNPFVSQFFVTLVKKNRLSLLSLIKEQMKRELNDLNDQIDVYVVSATQFTEASRKAFVAVIEQKTGKTVNPKFTLSDKYLGGFYAKVGQTVYDGTLDGSLQGLKTAIESIEYAN
ncbi:MAG: F-type H+-transporting ATPase subunit delta [Candidatus Marinamargulisbacteria bacterium]|jgi:F-type H+-transporting ATPase subunit delta